ncbi:hypothetical protein NEI02_06380 [Brachyspira pilosicoli]|uniref:Uncharacterized protein n=1 Tax=Brachyspira pilosicoli TaxID=52584 RepID=A0AAJ6G8L0_BRAPL|nr:hypothetical protein [Brachyspira pilosicoli]WIH89330.1 hypothetical protein NEI02_06380 [Brachyspira pilosicoli]WIH91625.1 hypothetical protein NEI01_06380 [Brachyspira pilosicoli]WIH94563.1 hypothetical protein NEH99_09720 [Brachyspira pilosicoli]
MKKCFYLIIENEIVGMVSMDKKKLSKVLKSVDTDITSFQEIELNTDFDRLLESEDKK